MKNITEIPELVKIMISLFGEKWGKRLGRAFVILALFTLVVVIMTTLFGHLPTSVLFWILGLVSFLVAVVGIPMMLGLFFGMIIRVGFATPTTIRIDNTLNTLLPLLRKANRGKLDRKSIQELLDDTKNLEAQWNKSKIVRFIHWNSKRKVQKRNKK
jgi:hypothetical protein